MLNWNRTDTEHVIVLQHGKAVIREDETSEGKVYKPHIEDNHGNIVVRFDPGFDDFERADTFVSVNLIELDRNNTDEATFREKLVSALDACIGLLPQAERAFHRRRLENIQRWLLRQPANRDSIDAPSTDWDNYVFNWQQDGSSFHCDTPPHGKAIITEHSRAQTSARYSIEIEDSIGIILKDYYTPSVDFQSVEARLREILSELEQPFVDEVYLDQITFTLQICQRLLPKETDLMQMVRLQYIEGYLGEVLP